MNQVITESVLRSTPRSSVVAVTDTSGLLLEETRYMPCACPSLFGGSVRSGVGTITGTDKSFMKSPSEASGIGQKVLPDTGLLDYNARMPAPELWGYSSELGRFTQPDTIVPGAGNSQAWNRYSYGLNNPIKYIDPSGHSVDCGMGEVGTCGGDTLGSLESEIANSTSYNPGLFKRWGDTSKRLVDYRNKYKGFVFPIVVNNDQPQNKILDDIDLIYKAFNWQLQAPKSFTIAQSPYYELVGGYRIYGNMEAVVDNDSPITIGPSSLSFQTPDISTVEAISSTLGVNISEAVSSGTTPWVIDINHTETIKKGSSNISATLGLQYKIRPDNVGLVLSPILAGFGFYYGYQLPILIGTASRIECPAFGC